MYRVVHYLLSFYQIPDTDT